MAKVMASFEIVAHDQNGERRPVGGDPFCVSVRGAANVYAKVNDNGDGSYRVDYKPSTSGAYTIAITLHGVPMPGSPFALTVLVPRADASRCVVRGEALKTITARQASSFDIEFADAFGQIAQAEELDVFVEPRPLPTLPEDTPPLPMENLIWAVVEPKLPKPLIVRENPDLDSGRVGEIGPGAMVGVLETQDLPDGSRRARVMYRPNSSRIGSSALLRSPPRSPERSRGASPATTRTNTPCHTPGRTPVTSARGSYPSSARGPGSARQSSARGPSSARAPSSARGLSSARGPNSARANSPGRSPRARSPGVSPRSPRMSSLFANPLDGMNGRSGSTPRVPSFARPIGDLSDRGARSRSPPTNTQRFFAPGALTADEAGAVGWVTAAKDGKETLVLRHLKLDASRRQSQMQLWASQLATEANRKAAEHRSQRSVEERGAAKAGPSCAHELEADKRGIGFAYGGVDPGTLHAHGKLIRSHSVHYSVGRAGEYLFHVGIRNQSAALPGSPFELVVKPGSAHPVATSLSMDEFGCALPLVGVVGDAGSVVIATSDRMGNGCVVGGAPFKVETKSKELQTTQVDNNDGTYAVQWLGEVSGKYELFVTIDNVNVTGSPCELTLQSAKPEVAKCEISGGGLSNAIAGEKVEVLVRCKDRFSNPTTPGTSMSFGLAVAPPSDHGQTVKDKKDSKDKSKDDSEKKEKKKDSTDEAASTLPSQDFEGKWLAEGEYQIRYVAEKAGDYELHLWCDVEGDGVREKVPNSPFQLHVVPNKASASGSLITGAEAVLNMPITAGERLDLGVHFRDDFGNACAPPERVRVNASMPGKPEEESPSKQPTRRGSTLTPNASDRRARDSKAGEVSKVGPSTADTRVQQEGVLAKLLTPIEEENITDKMRPADALGTFSVGYELHVSGNYEAHFTLNGRHLNGSPVCFRVKPSAPSGRLSTLHPPTDTPPVIGVLYELTLIAEDKYSNKLDRGGANVQARALGPSASPATTVDHQDGRYGVRFTAGAVGEYRVEVRLDNVKIKGSPHLLNFTEPTQAQRKQLASMGSASPGAGVPASFDSSFDVSDDVNGSPPPMRDSSPGRERENSESPPGSSRSGQLSGRGSSAPGSARRGSSGGRDF